LSENEGAFCGTDVIADDEYRQGYTRAVARMRLVGVPGIAKE
jgi:hypothetical protein